MVMKRQTAIFLSYTSFTLAAALYSCSDNSVNTTTTVPAGTVLFSRDSLSVWLPPSTYANGTDSFYTSLSNYSGNFALYFTLQSNVDSVHGIGRYGLYSNATPATPYSPWIYGTVDTKDSINLSFVSGTYLSMAAGLTVNNNTAPMYMRIKDIKVVKK